MLFCLIHKKTKFVLGEKGLLIHNDQNHNNPQHDSTQQQFSSLFKKATLKWKSKGTSETVR